MVVQKAFSLRKTPPLLYFGSKFRHPDIHRLFPDDIGRAALMGGGAGELIKIPKPTLGDEIYRDIHPDLVAFWLAVKQDPDGLALGVHNIFRKPSQINNSRYRPYFQEGADITPADFFVLSQSSFNGAGLRWLGGISTSKLDRVRLVELDVLRSFFRDVRNRIKDWDIQCSDVFDSLSDRAIAGRSDLFIYLDPPYLNSLRRSKDLRHKDPEKALSRKQYRFEFTDAQHEKLCKKIALLGSIQPIAISGYESQMYGDILLSEGWHLKRYKYTFRSGIESHECVYLSPAYHKRFA